MVTYRPGNYCDVVGLPDGFGFVWSSRPKLTVTLEVNDKARWAVTLPEAWLFTRAAASPDGSVIVAAQGQSGAAWYVLDGKAPVRLGKSVGVTPVVARWAADKATFEIAVQSSGTGFDIYRPILGTKAAGVMLATSQGFRDWPPTLTIPIRSDDAFRRTVGGWTFFQPCEREGVTVGQTNPAAIRVQAEGRVFTAIKGESYEPHVAVRGTKIAVCARTPQGAALAVMDHPYPAHEKPPVQPPVPDPDPPPEEPAPVPDPVPNLLSLVKTSRDGFASMPPGVERAFRIINRFCHLAQAKGYPFGLLAKPGGTNYNGYSIDVVLLKTGESWDILGDAEGEARPAWGRTSPTGMSDPAKWRAPVADDGGAQPPPVPDPPPQSGYDDTQLRQEIAALKTDLAALRTTLALDRVDIDRLTARIANLRVKGATSRTWGHAHEISLNVEG